MNTTHPVDTEADALNAPSLTPAQVTAQKLSERWEERERKSKAQHFSVDGEKTMVETTKSAAVNECRRELQAAFGLDSLGAQAGEPERKP